MATAATRDSWLTNPSPNPNHPMNVATGFGQGGRKGLKPLDVLEQSAKDQMAQLSPFQKAGLNQLGSMQQFSGAGTDALAMQRALLGLDGPEAMQAAYQENPAQAFARAQMEKTLTRNAAATGGLGGSGLQKALLEHNVGLTNQNIQNQLAQLSGLSGRGQQAAMNLYDTGYDAAQGVAGVYGQTAADKLGIEAAKKEEAARRRSKAGSSIGSAIGYGVGGPWGSMIGGSLGGAVEDVFGGLF